MGLLRLSFGFVPLCDDVFLCWCRMTLAAEVSRTQQVRNARCGSQVSVSVSALCLLLPPDAVKKPWERSNSAEKSSLVSRSEAVLLVHALTEILAVTRVSLFFMSE